MCYSKVDFLILFMLYRDWRSAELFIDTFPLQATLSPMSSNQDNFKTPSKPPPSLQRASGGSSSSSSVPYPSSSSSSLGIGRSSSSLSTCDTKSGDQTSKDELDTSKEGASDYI